MILAKSRSISSTGRAPTSNSPSSVCTSSLTSGSTRPPVYQVELPRLEAWVPLDHDAEPVSDSSAAQGPCPRVHLPYCRRLVLERVEQYSFPFQLHPFPVALLTVPMTSSATRVSATSRNHIWPLVSPRLLPRWFTGTSARVGPSLAPATFRPSVRSSRWSAERPGRRGLR